MPAKSKLGQNFLRDQAAIERIINALGDLTGRTVVEIGPGQGAITAALARRAARLIAVELDTALANALRKRFANQQTPAAVTILQQDVLAFDFAAAAREAREPLLVVGNLPYYITSPILLRLARNAGTIDRAVLMVQREVAQRVTAEPGSRDYGLLTATCALYGTAEELFTLPPEAFSPPPKVYSTVFRWSFAPQFAALGIPEAPFLAFLKQVFAQKRKTLSNNLRAAGFSPETIADAERSASIPAHARAESLPINQLAQLWRTLQPSSPTLAQ
uniref:Ribosomal RNA adenine methylase transferase N-terminal domain-containing protein n=1 Tax=mine drainage metagenome TaxID=410659 RepID=E6PZJ1_9ZZZZ